MKMGEKKGVSLHFEEKKDYHFLLLNLHEFDIDYLEALINNDSAIINQKEEAAKALGYGPRVPCTFEAEIRQTCQFCREYPSPFTSMYVYLTRTVIL